jgi:hypothetical protein
VGTFWDCLRGSGLGGLACFLSRRGRLASFIIGGLLADFVRSRRSRSRSGRQRRLACYSGRRGLVCFICRKWVMTVFASSRSSKRKSLARFMSGRGMLVRFTCGRFASFVSGRSMVSARRHRHGSSWSKWTRRDRLRGRTRRFNSSWRRFRRCVSRRRSRDIWLNLWM